jgi:PAS domain S-box-containing protein
MDSERTYKAIFEAANDAIAIYDAKTGAILDANRRMCEMYGYPRDEVKSLDIGIRSGGFPPFTQEDALRWIRKAATEGPQLFEWQAKDRDGRLFWVEVNLKLAAIDGQNFVLSVVRDISNRKLVEEELHATKDYLRTVFNSVHDAIFVHDCDGRVIDVNDKMLEMYRVTHEEAIDTSILRDYTAADYPVVAFPLLWKKVLSGENQFFEWKAKRPRDCSVFDVEVFLTKLRLPGGDVILANVRDITERKLAERELRATREYLRTVFDSVYDAIIVHDPGGRVVDVNDKMLDMYGVGREEALKLSIIDDYSASDNPIAEVWERWKKVLSGENQFFEWKAKRPKDGSVFNVEVFLTKLALPQGDAILANVRDVTDKKKAEDELKAKSLSLEEVNAALKVLLRQRDQDKNEMEGRIVDNVRKLVLPYVERLKGNRLEDEQKTCLNILETNLMNIVSSFVQKMASAYPQFTRSEILVANLIRDGKTVKEIAKVSGVSENAVNRHRQNIRNKLGLNRRKVSLKAYLMSFN